MTYPEGVLPRIQKIELELLEEFDRICKKHNLTYFLDGGSTLGAVRHGGFIPWDDDTDVGMPVEDYKRFLDIAPRELKSGISLHTYENTEGYTLFFAKLYKDGTRFLDENAVAAHCPQGIFIDIFPFYVLDANEKRGVSDRKKALFWQRMAFVKLNGNPHLPEGMAHRRLVGLACKIAHHTLARIWSLDRMHQKHVKAYQTSNPGTLWVNGCTGDAVPRREEWIFPTKEGSFEDLTVMLPRDCDPFLRAEYGDYTQIPPADKRRTHMPLYLDLGDGTNAMER